MFISSALDIDNQRVASLEDGKRLQMEEMLKEKILNLESSLEIQNKEKHAIQEELSKEKGRIMWKNCSFLIVSLLILMLTVYKYK